MSSASATDWHQLTAPAAGSRVVIVGGCGGIGRGVTAACLALGARVAVLDLPQSLAAHPPENAEFGVPIDACDEASVSSAFEVLENAWAALDIIIFLVGFTLTPPRRVEDISVKDWTRVVEGNLTSAHLVQRAALPGLRRGNQPCAVLVSSGLGVSVLPGFGPYAAAKAGVIALTKTLALENAPAIRFNAVAPGAVHTDFMKGGLGREDSDGAWFDPARSVAAIPLQRLADVADVIGPVLFLASPAAKFVTGQTIHVNGGRFMP